ncbi:MULTISPECIES: Ig-like domain-containing protein [Halolamina]|uniref:Ig-like domain (Group 1) n=1 Tax=Halolamina pelagica TaxID=699431 RepID=A0A1I5QNH4_9EURY|nr:MULTISPECIES: Ig-like domain-containing protein [Halolamina]NHX35468.1 hypothetical protein [Halolamina sp. R1-12]SFP47772.1 Ig-like domain (group 1) [Halolamina pelagica]
MKFWGDDRGQSIQVGAILLFGILIILLATFQATVIPEQNAAIEFDHSRAAQSDMQDLRNGLLQASGGDAVPTRVNLGTTYPNRLFFINPPPAAGRLRTVGDEDPTLNVTLANSSGAVTVGSDYENARKYWASAGRAGVFNTSHIVYTPDYAQYDSPPTTVYENSLLYNRFSNGANRTLSGQQLVQGTTVNLVALQGDLQASGTGAKTVEMTTISAATRTVTVRSEIGDPLNITITSALPASRWNDDDLLGAQPRATAFDDGDVTVDGETYHRVAIKLEEGETYELRTSAVGVGAVPNDELVPDPAYLVVTEEFQPVANGSTDRMTVEVRDRYNNPVTGAQVNVSVDGQYLNLSNRTATGDSVTFETNSEGRAEITYTGTNSTGSDSAWLNASIGGEGYEYRNVTGIEVPKVIIGGGGGDGGGDGVNPAATGDLILDSESVTGGNSVELVFNNTLDSQVNVSAARLNFYYCSKKNKCPSAADVTVGTDTRASNVQIGGNYETISPKIEVGPNDTGTTFTLEFDEDPADSGTNRDFFVLTLVFETNGGTQQATYFVGL